MAEAAAPVADWLPLSDAQRVVWLDLRLGADPRAYLVATRLRIDAAVDAEAARRSFAALTARHDALRLRVDPEQPRQRVAPVAAPPLTLHELPDGPEGEAALEALFRRLANLTLPLGDHPLVAIDLARLGKRRCELLLRCHHLVTDSAGSAIALQRWLRTHEILDGDVAEDLPPGSSFVATLAADAAYAASPQAAADLAHWRRRFDNLP